MATSNGDSIISTCHDFVLVYVEAGIPLLDNVYSTREAWRGAELAILQSTKRAPVPTHERPTRGQ